MFTEFYGLTALPFQLTPDSRFFFDSSGHSKALAHLTYGLQQGDGFIVITGDVGTGKTMLVEHLWSQLDTNEYIAAKLSSTQLSPTGFLGMIAAAFGLSYSGRDKTRLLRELAAFFDLNYASGKRTLMVIDEVQNLPFSTLEELRMLSNLTIGHHASLQIFLIGQPQFRSILASANAEQLRQRVFTSYHLGPLNEPEVKKYIEHRLQVVGWSGDPAFEDAAFTTIFNVTRGTPRKINLLCSRLLLWGFLEGEHIIGDRQVKEVASEWLSELEPRAYLNDMNRTSIADPKSDLVPRIENIERRLARHDIALEQALNVITRFAPTAAE
jgi:general secretion pathway protein A